jgi:hypothetical protein
MTLPAPRYRLLDRFAGAFSGTQYRHRRSNVGNLIALELYEDLFTLRKSTKLVERIEARHSVLNVNGDLTGIVARRADGTFGERTPGVEPVDELGYSVSRGHLALVEIGVEVKILAKAMIKQIDRVGSDLRGQIAHFRRGGGNPISVGIVGVNHAEHYTSYEGDRAFSTTGKGGHSHPAQEAARARARLEQDASPHFDEFLFLDFKANNEPPYPFEWLDERRTLAEYGAVLTRISRKYDSRF